MCSNNKKYDFTGKVALITGSSSGIGAAIALQLASYGAQVTIHGRDSMALSNVAKEIEQATNGKHQPLQIIGDLLDHQVPEKLINETLSKYGRLDILVNNAGGGSPNDSLLNENLMDAYDKVFTLNVRSVLHLTHLAAPHLEKTKGNIINISSVAAMKPVLIVYSSSKAALDMITKASAQELASKGIRVNSINPGPVFTNIFRSMNTRSDSKENIREYMKKITALNMVPDPVEIANLASFLASDDARNITGSIMVSDTGVMVKKTIINDI